MAKERKRTSKPKLKALPAKGERKALKQSEASAVRGGLAHEGIKDLR